MKKWLIPVITVVGSIIVPIVAGWYAISKSQQSISLAEVEKTKKVKENLVAIVEEHIINEKCIDNTRLARLIDLKTRDECLQTKISTRELMEEAEYNILSSRYLDFKHKEKYKNLFDNFHRVQGAFDVKTFENSPYQELLNELINAVSGGDEQKAFNLIVRINEAYVKDLSKLKSQGERSNWISYLLLEKPYFMIVIIIYFVFVILIYFSLIKRRYMRQLERAKEEIETIREKMESLNEKAKEKAKDLSKNLTVKEIDGLLKKLTEERNK